MRKFLVYIAAKHGVIVADLFRDCRLFDVALNDYTGDGIGMEQADRTFARFCHKWPGIFANLADVWSLYDAVAFFDDDIAISTEAMNQLFLTGMSLGLNLWQAALTHDSYHSHAHTLQRADSFVRRVGMVEIMMPVFSRRALKICWPTLGECKSGYGLDYVWPKLLANQGLAVVDAIAAKHTRPIQSEDWISDGKTPFQEWSELERKYQLKAWKYYG